MSYQTENSQMLRACVFIDSSNPGSPNQIVNNSPHLFIKPPFPPLIDPKDLLIISKDNKPSRSPNAFIIYRKVFLKTTREQGYFLPMTIVSSMASKSWDQETDEVKSYYKKLAKEAYKYRTEKFPKKVKRRRKKEPWNSNIAFQNDTFLNRTEYSSDLQPTENAFSLSNHDIISQNSSLNLEQNNETLLLNDNNLQEYFPSPDLSNNSSIMSSPEFNDLEQINIESCNQNILSLNQNDPSDYVEFTNFASFDVSSGSNQIDQTYQIDQIDQIDYSNYNNTECFTLCPILTQQYQPYQDVLGINFCSEYENVF